MKNFVKKIFIAIAVLVTAAITINSALSIPTYARSIIADDPIIYEPSNPGTTNPDDPADSDPSDETTYEDDCTPIIGFIKWYCNVNPNPANEDELTTNIIAIATNVFIDVTVLASYLVLGYVIYGGYLYIFASGDPGKVSNGKKTLTHAFIGLAIVLLANVILNAIRIALIGNTTLNQNCANEITPGSGYGCIEPGALVANTIQWVISIAGIVALVFVVIGGISYMTSAGDPGKVKKAKDTILYALIGLVIVALAHIITAFVTNIIKDARKTSYTKEILIAKEYHEK